MLLFKDTTTWTMLNLQESLFRKEALSLPAEKQKSKEVAGKLVIQPTEELWLDFRKVDFFLQFWPSTN